MHSPPSDSIRRLLVADEDPLTCRFLQDNLTADGYHVDVADSSNAALRYLRDQTPDLILVDINGNTLSLVDHVRESDQARCAAPTDTPIIALTAHDGEVHRVRLLQRGSDDVITKPFSYPELRARVEAVLRRMAPRRPATVVTAGPVRIDRRRRSATIDGRDVELRGLEYALLCALAAEPSRVFTRDELMDAIWGYRSTRTRTLDSHACRLRVKLANDTHRLIVNVWGVGYRLIDETPA